MSVWPAMATGAHSLSQLTPTRTLSHTRSLAPAFFSSLTFAPKSRCSLLSSLPLVFFLQCGRERFVPSSLPPSLPLSLALSCFFFGFFKSWIPNTLSFFSTYKLKVRRGERSDPSLPSACTARLLEGDGKIKKKKKRKQQQQ